MDHISDKHADADADLYAMRTAAQWLTNDMRDPERRQYLIENFEQNEPFFDQIVDIAARLRELHQNKVVDLRRVS